MKAFKVWLGRKHIDTVFYDNGVNVDKEEVKRSLINHDGYDPSIVVTLTRKPTTKLLEYEQLTGQSLADQYAKVYAQYVSKESGVPVSKCNIWATYKGGGWIEICGSGVPARKDMQAQYPNGWTLLDKKRSSYVRDYITKQTEVEA